MFFFNEMTYLALICEQRYSVLKFGQLFGFVHCSGTKKKNKQKTHQIFSSLTSQEPVAYTLL